MAKIQLEASRIYIVESLSAFGRIGRQKGEIQPLQHAEQLSAIEGNGQKIGKKELDQS